jgi:polyisoprenoid-binding protein YceI
MRTFLTVCVAVLAVAAAQPGATTLKVKSGTVRYEVVIKTLGISGGTIVGTNKKVLGQIHSVGEGRVQGGLIVPVVNFESNNTRRDKDVARILKYEEFPAITFEVVEMEQGDIDNVLSLDGGEVPMKAKISVAGGSKIYDMVLQFERLGENEIRCTTEVDAKFTDFGLKPPSFGLILKTAPDAVRLSGELVCAVEGD